MHVKKNYACESTLVSLRHHWYVFVITYLDSQVDDVPFSVVRSPTR